ncbi:MAG: F0F1 ATP synthase subunit delta [Candidatus Saccharibacteria bacterium]
MNNKISRRVIAQTVASKLVADPSRRTHWLKMLAAYMVNNKMQDDLDLMVNDLVREIYALSGELLVDVTTARPLSQTIRADIARSLREVTGAREVLLREQTDPELLGGFIARTPDAELDGSLRTKLKQLASI